MNEKAFLIDWIHRVEYDLKEGRPTKRRPSLVTELYFERHLSKLRELNLPAVIAFGWMKRFCWKKQCTEWFKIASNDSLAKKQPTLLFIKEISKRQPQDKFYLVQYEVQSQLSMPNTPPSVVFKVTSLLREGDSICRYTTKDSLQLSAELTAQTANELKHYVSTRSDNEIGPWLELLSTTELKKLLSTRCLMNFSSKNFTDIDGIGINDSGTLTFVEFKRKDPAHGLRYRLLQNPRLETYLEIAKNLNKKERKAWKVKQAGQIPLKDNQPGAELENTERWETVMPNEGCFGLDTSHAENILLCSNNDWVYRYVIWNHMPATVGELFNHRLVPWSSQDLRYLDIESRHIDGISRADGKKSGSYTKGVPRYQLMIKVEDFLKAEL
ncbi:hypothetical protein [Paludibacterium denitrificans]|uniref:Uncharacterized protein n=1 Tax=Paludibacterium denitrificans TaxID=2675226 RepID=A0A844GHI5_9NEIS|nr:hypothetical protein [Paludibacterium denitrificans]MTD34124.1 hypothetical protein [Paludibacterium denitrificans]